MDGYLGQLFCQTELTICKPVQLLGAWSLIIDHGDGQDKYEACVFVLMSRCSSSSSPCTRVLFETKRPSPPSIPHRQPLQVQPGDGNSGGAALLHVQVPGQQQGSLPVRHCYLQRCDDDGGVDPKELGNTKNGLGSPKPERSLDINWEGRTLPKIKWKRQKHSNIPRRRLWTFRLWRGNRAASPAGKESSSKWK